ncbi:ATP-grasp fold amidoligase family protein [Lutimonas zeaxanthinifaciens]|uniref:ATP-grasp fold amidoligase family protein n=1 Tax=Lutimonas zeaxanthinifaciens TaxID=3060215 RepID=UPI00265CA064|nr:ATP-grasp fold amidoligase family protein [Lutimonas sp. YSD2104]WKK64931.1 ATP-grasp fold amidoligase family protein [Lutimonas sp. YSD2104]
MDFYAKIYYEYYHGEKLDLDNPGKYVEKLQWLKVYFHPPILNQLVDKYAVREYVKERIGEKFLNKLYQVCSDFETINFEKLPDRFVVKGTHGSNMHMIVKDKETLNKRKLKFNVWKWKRKNLYFHSGQEWAYKNVKPRLVIEKYMEDKNGELLDFKLFCFNGSAKFIQVHKWHLGNKCLAHYDLNWKKMEVTSQDMKNYPGEIRKPEKLKQMIELASILSEKLPFVRVDLYEVDGKVFFGELTFYPSDARKNFYPEDFNQKVANYLVLPELPKGSNEIVNL